jgi:hypothetical protein
LVDRNTSISLHVHADKLRTIVERSGRAVSSVLSGSSAWKTSKTEYQQTPICNMSLFHGLTAKVTDKGGHFFVERCMDL